MILPTKHLAPERALITVGAELLEILREPKTVSRTWDELRALRHSRWPHGKTRFDWFVLALDLLFLLGTIRLEEGLLVRSDS